jgi:type II secretory pathway pseudopilin PulG
LKKADKIITNSHQKKTGKGFTLIEITIFIVIVGIVFGFCGIYFISSWRNSRISEQNVYLQREARYAMDFIINGQMKNDTNEIYRYGGIISSHNSRIYKTSAGNRIEGTEGEEIFLYNNNDDNDFIGRIYPYPSNDPTSLIFDRDEVRNGNEYRIIPRGASGTGINDPYTITINFKKKESAIHSSININLEIYQSVYDRNLNIKMNSTVNLRNYYQKE